jgi:hypothetical protein
VISTQPESDSNRCDCRVKALSSDTQQRPRAGAKHTIPSEPQPEPKRGKRQNSTASSLLKASPNPLRGTNTTAVTPKDGTPESVHREAEGGQCTTSESRGYDQHRDWPESAKRNTYTDTTISSPSDPLSSEEISGVHITDMLGLLRLDGTFIRSFLSPSY